MLNHLMDHHDLAERITYGEEGFYHPSSGNIPEKVVNIIRTGQQTIITQDQMNVVTSPANVKFSVPVLMYLIAGVMAAAVVKSLVSGNADVSKLLIFVLIAAVCVVVGILAKGHDTSESALANEGMCEAYVHTVQNKQYYIPSSTSAQKINSYFITVAGEKFSVTERVYDQLMIGGYVTCIISARGGMYYIDFTA